MQAGQLRGEPCDLRALTAASEALGNLLKPVFSSAEDQAREDEVAQAELRKLLEGVLVYKRAKANEDDPTAVDPNAPIAEWRVPRRKLSSPPEADDAEVIASSPPPPPVPAPAPQRFASAMSTGCPANYLKGSDEPWRSFVSENGEIMVPGAGGIRGPVRRDWSR